MGRSARDQRNRTNRAAGRIVQEASDWPNGIISTAPCHLRVVGILEMVDVSLVSSPFQNYAGIIDQTPFEARIYHLWRHANNQTDQ